MAATSLLQVRTQGQLKTIFFNKRRFTIFLLFCMYPVNFDKNLIHPFTLFLLGNGRQLICGDHCTMSLLPNGLPTAISPLNCTLGGMCAIPGEHWIKGVLYGAHSWRKSGMQ
jgi:hypothetical protein